MLLTDAIIKHHAIMQLVLVLALLQPEELEHFQLLVPGLVQSELVQQRRIRLCRSLCHSLRLEHSMAGMNRSLVLQRCMRCSLLLALLRSKSGETWHNGSSGVEHHNDCGFCISPVDSNCFGQLQRCWQATLQPTRTKSLDVASFYPL